MPVVERHADRMFTGTGVTGADKARLLHEQAARRGRRVRLMCGPCRKRIDVLTEGLVYRAGEDEWMAHFRAVLAGRRDAECPPAALGHIWGCPRCGRSYPVTWLVLREEFSAALRDGRAIELPLRPGR
jgi:hypothetical protein